VRSVMASLKATNLGISRACRRELSEREREREGAKKSGQIAKTEILKFLRNRRWDPGGNPEKI